MKKNILTLAAALTFSLCASAQTQYVMQIKKNNGDVVRVNADEVQDVTFESAALSNRTALIDHVRTIAKGMAEQGVNMGARNVITEVSSEFAKVLVANVEFLKGIKDASVELALKSAKDVEEGSELQQMGYSKYIEWGIDKLNGRYTFKTDGAPTVEAADQIEVIFPVTTKEGGIVNCMTTLKGSGNTVGMVFPVLSDRTIALVLQVPETIMLESGRWSGGMFTKLFDTAFNNTFEANGTSKYVSFLRNKWSLNGVQHSFLKVTEGVLLPDENTISFGVGFDPVSTGQITSTLGFEQNNQPILSWNGSVTIPSMPIIIPTLSTLISTLKQGGDTTGSGIDLSGLASGSGSILDLLMPLLAGSTIDNMEAVAMGDLGFKVKVTDLPKFQTLLMQLREARYQRKGEAAIDALVQQLNAITEGTVSCKALSQELPFKMVTKKFGVNYIPAPAVKFADEEDYVPLTDLTDKETLEYTINFLASGVPQLASNGKTMINIFATLLQLINFEKK